MLSCVAGMGICACSTASSACCSKPTSNGSDPVHECRTDNCCAVRAQPLDAQSTSWVKCANSIQPLPRSAGRFLLPWPVWGCDRQRGSKDLVVKGRALERPPATLFSRRCSDAHGSYPHSHCLNDSRDDTS